MPSKELPEPLLQKQHLAVLNKKHYGPICILASISKTLYGRMWHTKKIFVVAFKSVAMSLHWACKLLSNGSSHVILSCHSFCINILALITTSATNPSGSNKSCRTSRLVIKCTWARMDDYSDRWSFSDVGFHQRPNTLTVVALSAVFSLLAMAMSWALLDDQLCKFLTHDGSGLSVIFHCCLFCFTAWDDVVHVEVREHIIWHRCIEMIL